MNGVCCSKDSNYCWRKSSWWYCRCSAGDSFIRTSWCRKNTFNISWIHFSQAHELGLSCHTYPYTCCSPVAIQCSLTLIEDLSHFYLPPSSGVNDYSKWVVINLWLLFYICIYVNIYIYICICRNIQFILAFPNLHILWYDSQPRKVLSAARFMSHLSLCHQDALLRASDAQLAAKMQTLAQQWPRSDPSRVSMQVGAENVGLLIC